MFGASSARTLKSEYGRWAGEGEQNSKQHWTTGVLSIIFAFVFSFPSSNLKLPLNTH